MNSTMEFYKYDSLNWLSSATSRGIIPQIINYSGSPEFLISKNPWNFTHPVIPEPKKKSITRWPITWSWDQQPKDVRYRNVIKPIK